MTEFLAEIVPDLGDDLDGYCDLIHTASRLGCHGVVFPFLRVERMFDRIILQSHAECRDLRHQELPRHLIGDLSACAHQHSLQFGLAPNDPTAVATTPAQVDFFLLSPTTLPYPGFIRRCSATGLPLLMGTAMADANEVWNATQTVLEYGCTDLTLLHGVVPSETAPVPATSCNLAAMGTLRELLIREYAETYPRADLKVGWTDRSCSPRVIGRAVRHWSAATITFALADPTRVGNTPHNGWHWRPDRIAEVIAGGYQPAHRESDGDGRIAPSPDEARSRRWRADPDDGRRPQLSARLESHPATTGPLVYILVSGSSDHRLRRCLALADNLRTHHTAQVQIVIGDHRAHQARCDRLGLPNRFSTNFVHTVQKMASTGPDDQPAICVADIDQPAAAVATAARAQGLRTVVFDQLDCRAADLIVVPRFGWRNRTAQHNAVGGTHLVCVSPDAMYWHQHRRQNLHPRRDERPRVLVHFGGGDAVKLTTCVTQALSSLADFCGVRLLLSPESDPQRIEGEILAALNPHWRIAHPRDAVEPMLAATELLITDVGPLIADALHLGVPVLVVAGQTTADVAELEWLANCGAVMGLMGGDGVEKDEVARTLRQVLAEPGVLAEMRGKAVALGREAVDGLGAMRMAGLICGLGKT